MITGGQNFKTYSSLGLKKAQGPVWAKAWKIEWCLEIKNGDLGKNRFWNQSLTICAY